MSERAACPVFFIVVAVVTEVACGASGLRFRIDTTSPNCAEAGLLLVLDEIGVTSPNLAFCATVVGASGSANKGEEGGADFSSSGLLMELLEEELSSELA